MSIIDYLFPQAIKCLLCNTETSEGICHDCKKSLPYIKGNLCKICGGRLIADEVVCNDCKDQKYYFEHNYCVLDYSGYIRHLILDCKQNGNKYIATALSSILYDKFCTLKEKFDIIIPVPMHSYRRKERGFNQAETLAEDIAIATGKVRNNILIRNRHTPHQTGLDKANRMDNIKGAFKVIDRKSIKGKTILIIDDIYTTGATINECARTLKLAGADKVYGLCLCRTPIDYNKVLDNDGKDE